MFTWKNSEWAKILWTILRVYLGYNWLIAGYGKVFGESSAAWVGANAGTAVTGFLKGALTKTGGAHPDVQAWYAWFINHLALPNVKLFSYSVAWGELLVGVALILGVLTTYALFGSLFLNFNYLFAGSISVNPIYIIEALILLWAGGAAYYWGADRFIHERRGHRHISA